MNKNYIMTGVYTAATLACRYAALHTEGAIAIVAALATGACFFMAMVRAIDFIIDRKEKI